MPENAVHRTTYSKILMEKRPRKRRRSRKSKRLIAYASRQVLNDAIGALEELEPWLDKPASRQFRLRWITCLAVLRAVGHVLHKVDGANSPEIRQAAAAAKARWEREPLQHRIFHDFIEAQRNIALKEYRFSYWDETEGREPLLVGGYLMLPEAAVNAGIGWWKKELAAIENAATYMRNAAQEQNDKQKKSRGGGKSGRVA